jgi:hypothetical protein
LSHYPTLYLYSFVFRFHSILEGPPRFNSPHDVILSEYWLETRQLIGDGDGGGGGGGAPGGVHVRMSDGVFGVNGAMDISMLLDQSPESYNDDLLDTRLMAGETYYDCDIDLAITAGISQTCVFDAAVTCVSVTIAYTVGASDAYCAARPPRPIAYSRTASPTQLTVTEPPVSNNIIRFDRQLIASWQPVPAEALPQGVTVNS